MIEHYYAVIMAGGGGTRLWPLSRKDRPKQMLQLTGDRTMFQVAVDRLAGVFTPDHILVVTVAEQAALLREQCPEIPGDNYLIEPAPRGTASVVGLAAMALRIRDPQAVMAVLTADHFIENIHGFQQLLHSAAQVAQAGWLVTLGIQPTYPATGYGYIQRGEALKTEETITAFRVLKFKEKPDEETARGFLETGDHDWNSGMFIWRVDRILDEIQTLMPALADTLAKIAAAWNTDQQNAVVQQLWGAIQPQTIDYGIMEKAQKVVVLPAGALGWNDVGSWESLFDVLSADEHGNIILGANHIGIDTRSSLVCADRQKRLIVTIGVNDLVVVDTGDAVLICPRSDSQRVKDVVSQLKQTGRTEYL